MSERSKRISEKELKSDIRGAAIAKELGYNQEYWKESGNPLKMKEYDEIGKYSKDTVARRFSSKDRKWDGFNNIKEELGLETLIKSENITSQNSPEKKVNEINDLSENDEAPPKTSDIVTKRYDKGGELYGSYLDAVWLSKNEPDQTWFASNEDNLKEYKDIIRGLTRENYWSGDSELNEKNFEAPEEDLFPVYNPRKVKIKRHTKTSHVINNLNNSVPNLRIGESNGRLKIDEQEEIVKLAVKSNTYLELLKKTKSKDISEKDIRKILDPNADPENGGSFGRWMNQSEFPENTPMMAYGNDKRPEP